MNKALVIKLLALSSMALILIFALFHIEWKVQERKTTRDIAVGSIARQYAESQQFAGPLLWLHCSEIKTLARLDEKNQPRLEQVQSDCSQIIRPTQLSANGRLDVEERQRGIYKARLYLARLRLESRFEGIKLDLKPNQTLKGAYWLFSVSDPRGLRRIAVRDAQGKPLSVNPGTAGSSLESGFHIAIPPESLALPQTLSADIELAGSGRFDWLPVARQNDFRLTSAWPHPGFSGNYLPEVRTVSKKGFEARWRINDFATGGDTVLARSHAGVAEAGEYAPPVNQPSGFRHAFGVSLIDPVDAYVQSDRAVRYGFLFILLTLGGFFLFELLRRKPLHPLQYLLVGFAVVVFFLLLLALSEHIGFLPAYLVAAAACTALIAAYGRTLLGNWKASGLLGAGYSLLYAGLYQLLASEDHALLMGAWLTFAVLALTMYLTRRLNWQEIGQPSQPAPTGLRAE